MTVTTIVAVATRRRPVTNIEVHQAARLRYNFTDTGRRLVRYGPRHVYHLAFSTTSVINIPSNI